MQFGCDRPRLLCRAAVWPCGDGVAPPGDAFDFVRDVFAKHGDTFDYCGDTFARR